MRVSCVGLEPTTVCSLVDRSAPRSGHDEGARSIRLMRSCPVDAACTSCSTSAAPATFRRVTSSAPNARVRRLPRFAVCRDRINSSNIDAESDRHVRNCTDSQRLSFGSLKKVSCTTSSESARPGPPVRTCNGRLCRFNERPESFAISVAATRRGGVRLRSFVRRLAAQVAGGTDP